MRDYSRPTMRELESLWRILNKATHRNVADAMLKGFMFAVWPEWYERNKWEQISSAPSPSGQE